jgi:hypothetical protein
VPSIRNDLPVAAAAARRSLADSQNYGDDPTARDLINPPAFSEFNIRPESTFEHRDLPYLQALFTKVGYDLPSNIYRAVYDETEEQFPGNVSINNFRGNLNVLLDALESGTAQDWCRARGISMR